MASPVIAATTVIAADIQPGIYHHIDDIPEYIVRDGQHYKLYSIPKNFRGLHAPLYRQCDPPVPSLRRTLLGWLGYH